MATSKYWAANSSDSESDDSDSSDNQAPAAQTAASKNQRWAAQESSSEEEMDKTKRVVRSHTDKRYEQMLERIKGMANHQKNDDFAALITDYEAIMKMLEKLRSVVEQDGGPPTQFVKAIHGIEKYVDKLHAEHLEKKQEDSSQKLTQNKQKAFNTLRAKVRKGNIQFRDHLTQLEEHPSDFQSSESENDESADDASEGALTSGSSSGSSSDSDSNSGSSSSSSGSSDSGSDSDASGDSDSESSDSNSWRSNASESDGDESDEEAVREKKMLKWLITPEKLKRQQAKDKDKEDSKKEKQPKHDKYPSKKKKTSSSHAGPVAEDAKQDYTPEELVKKVKDIVSQRGHKRFERSSFMEKLEALMSHAVKQGPRAQLYIYSSMVAVDFDNPASAHKPIKMELWNEALDKINKMLPLLIQSWIQLKDSGADMSKLAVLDADGEEEDPSCHPRLQELFVTYAEKLDDELYKGLQFTTDVYSTEYQEILGNASKYMVLLQHMVSFFEETKQAKPLSVVSMRLLEQVYYKPDMLNAKVFEAITHSIQNDACHEAIKQLLPGDKRENWAWPADSTAFIAQLCRHIYQTNDLPTERTPTQRRAALCQAYHLALHDRFQAGRDLLHLGSLQEHANESDVHMQIQYNRVIAQMGLCAFRLGKIQEAHNCLMDVCQHSKAKELLAQQLSYNKNQERTPDQEREEKRRLLPYHMHINLEVLESAHFICAMLLEVPNLAMQSLHPNRDRVVSRVLRKEFERYDKLPFAGPPESAKESVVSAAKALQRGNWQAACETLETLKIWDHIDPGKPENGVQVKAMIKEKIKVEALRTYLFAYSSIYDAFHIDQLVGMFDLAKKTIHSVVSKMMFKEEITAFWDESSKYVLMQHVEPTPLQRLALTLSDRVAQVVENNEKLTGGKGFMDQRVGGAGPGRWDQPGDGKGGRRFGKGGQAMSGMQDDGKGRKGRSKGSKSTFGPPRNRGWDNARAGALRGNTQRGWSTRPT